MKRHSDDMSQKSKRFSYNNDNRSSLHPSPQSGGGGGGSGGGGGGGGGGGSGSYFGSYSSSMWIDPRSDPKGHSNMNVFQPQNVMMQWTNPKYDFHDKFFSLLKSSFQRYLWYLSLYVCLCMCVYICAQRECS